MTKHRTLLVCLLTAPFFLAGLGSTYLWTDEAQTAQLGVAVLNSGVPLTGTGADSLSAHCGEDAGWRGLHLQIPWLQAYLAAFSIGLLGKSSIAARLPFALLGWACVPMSSWLLGLAGARTRERILAALLTGTSVYFLLHARQARYYALAAFFTLAIAGAYWLYLERSRRSELWLALAMTALVLSFDPAALGVLLGITVHSAFRIARGSGERGREFQRLVATLAAPGIALIGWIAIASTASSRQALDLGARMLTKPIYYLVHLNAHVIPFLVVIPLMLLLVLRGSQWSERMRMLAMIGCLGTGGVLLAMAPPMAFGRYMIGVVPLIFCGMALMVGELADRFRRPAVVTAIIGAFLISGVPHKISHDIARSIAFALGFDRVEGLHPSENWRPDLVDLIGELNDPPLGPVAAAVEHLNGYAAPGEAILVTYGVPTLRFHTELDPFGGLTCEMPAAGAPEWIWLRGPWRTHRLSVKTLEWLDEHVDLDEYETVTLDAPDRQFENREDFHQHVFTNPGPEAPPTVLLRRTFVGSAGRE